MNRRFHGAKYMRLLLIRLELNGVATDFRHPWHRWQESDFLTQQCRQGGFKIDRRHNQETAGNIVQRDSK